MTPSGKNDPILMAYEFDGVGGGRALIENEVGAAQKDKHLAWVHLYMKEEGAKPWLEKEISYLDPHIVNALLADETRPRVTEIGDGAFIGSNTALVAPVRVGSGAYVGAGSTITKDIPDESLGVARGRQIIKKGWAARKSGEED